MKVIENIEFENILEQMEKESFQAENDMWSGQVVALEDVERILRGEMGDMRNGRIVKSDCQRCPYGSCSCLNIGFQKDADNIVREVVACNEDWI